MYEDIPTPDYLKGDAGYTVILIDNPAPQVRRITMNRPEKRNALNHALRGEVGQGEIRLSAVLSAAQRARLKHELRKRGADVALLSELQVAAGRVRIGDRGGRPVTRRLQ